MKENQSKEQGKWDGFFAFFCVMAYIFGGLGTIGYLVWLKAWPFVIFQAGILAMAFPYFREQWRRINP